MDDIELDNLDNKPEEEPEEQEEETNVDTDWRDESIIIIDTSNPDATGTVRGDLDAMKNADRELGKRIGAKNRTYTESKKSLLREMDVNINKNDGPFAKTIFERLRLTMNRKGMYNGAEFDGVKIIVQKAKRLEYTEGVKKASKVNEFKELVKKAEEEHARTTEGFVEESISDVPASEELVHSVIRNSIKNLDILIDENTEEVETELNNPAYVITEEEDREARGLMELSPPTELQEEGGISAENKIAYAKIEEAKWKERFDKEENPKKKALYKSLVKLAKLKADYLRLSINQRPESEEVQNIVKEEAQNNIL